LADRDTQLTLTAVLRAIAPSPEEQEQQNAHAGTEYGKRRPDGGLCLTQSVGHKNAQTRGCTGWRDYGPDSPRQPPQYTSDSPVRSDLLHDRWTRIADCLTSLIGKGTGEL
jgi:hypothetical protein